MPTGYMVKPSGLSGHVIQVPKVYANKLGVRDGNNSALEAGGNAPDHQPELTVDYGLNQYDYGLAGVTEPGKANGNLPSNQGHRALASFKAGRAADTGSNQPSRSQYLQGYTQPIQVFAASNTWQIAGATSKGKRASQPSLKFVSPFSSGAIPTRMPWDL